MQWPRYHLNIARNKETQKYIRKLFNQFPRCSMIVSRVHTRIFTKKKNRKEDEHCFFFFIKWNCPPLKSISDRHSNLFEMSKQKNALKCSTIWFVGCITSEENKTRWMSALMTIRRQILLKTTPSPKPKKHNNTRKNALDVFLFLFTQCNAYTHENMIGIFWG